MNDFCLLLTYAFTAWYGLIKFFKLTEISFFMSFSRIVLASRALVALEWPRTQFHLYSMCELKKIKCCRWHWHTARMVKKNYRSRILNSSRLQDHKATNRICRAPCFVWRHGTHGDFGGYEKVVTNKLMVKILNNNLLDADWRR
jgi:hypothetical protein